MGQGMALAFFGTVLNYENLQATERCRRESAKGQAEKMEHTKYPHTKGSFTLPGEAGCEALTLELADQWGQM